MMHIAGMSIDIDHAASLLGSYPQGTLRQYDGRAISQPDHWRSFSQEDIDAVRVIERRALNGDEVAARILEADLDWQSTPDREIDIASVEPHSHAYDQLSRFFVSLTDLHRVGQAIASKLMYLKWPAATPIQDSFLMDVYGDEARAVRNELAEAQGLPAVAEERGWQHLFLEAVRRDVVRNRESGAFESLRQSLTAAQELPADIIERLSDVRLLDMVAWADTSAS